MIYESILETIGNTPIVKLKTDASMADVYVKLEYFNPAGSVKDRIALNMIEKMEEDGRLKKGMTLVEPTSGNTGIGLALVAAAKGYKALFVMPETMSLERRNLMRAYGAQLILTEGIKGMKGAIEKAEEIVKNNKNTILLSQFENVYNPMVHMEKTAKEIISDFGDSLDVFISGVGTGGTITGVSRVFKEHNLRTKIVAVEPSDSPVLSGGSSGPHKIQGIGAGFIPRILDTELIDDIYQVTSDDAIQTTKKIAQDEGLLLGISSGAAIFSGLQEAKKIGSGKKILVMAADHGERYLSTELFKVVIENE